MGCYHRNLTQSAADGEPNPYLLKVVPHYLGRHQHQHEGQAVRHVARGLDQDDGQTQGHSHDAPCRPGGQSLGTTFSWGSNDGFQACMKYQTVSAPRY